jgi:hypothetical protein
MQQPERPLSAALAEVCPFDPELLPRSAFPVILDLCRRAGIREVARHELPDSGVDESNWRGEEGQFAK